MKVSEHIERINQCVSVLMQEIQAMHKEGHTQNNAPAWSALNDIELDIIELRNAILEDSYNQ